MRKIDEINQRIAALEKYIDYLSQTESVFAKGDYVKIEMPGSRNDGSIAVVVGVGAFETTHDNGDISIEPILLNIIVGENAKKHVAGKPQYLAKATVEEVKWAKIGRKVNEYRVGDIIDYDNRHPKELYEVSHVEKDEVYFFCDEFGKETEYMPNYSKDIKLIAPAESRF